MCQPGELCWEAARPQVLEQGKAGSTSCDSHTSWHSGTSDGTDTRILSPAEFWLLMMKNKYESQKSPFPFIILCKLCHHRRTHSNLKRQESISATLTGQTSPLVHQVNWTSERIVPLDLFNTHSITELHFWKKFLCPKLTVECKAFIFFFIFKNSRFCMKENMSKAQKFKTDSSCHYSNIKLKQFKMEIEYLWCILVVFNNYLENGKSVVYFLSSQPNCTANPIYNDSSVIFLKPKSLGEHTNSTRITSLGQRALAERRRVWKVYLCKPGSSWEKSNTKYVPSEKCPLVNLIYHYWTTHPPHTSLL